MTAGVAVYNDSGTLLFDENCQNLAVFAAGTGTISSLGYINSFQVANCKYPLLAIKANGRAWGTTTFAADGTTVNVFISGDPGVQVTWYLFDRTVTASNYGLVVYRADGSIAFDAAQKNARVVDVWTGDFNTGLGTRTYPGGRSYAICWLKLGYLYKKYSKFISTNNYQTQFEETFSNIQSWNGTSLTVNSVFTVTNDVTTGVPVTPITNDSSAWAIAVLDVTGY